MSRHPFDLPLLPLSPSDPLPWGYLGSIEHRSLAALSRLDGMMSASSKADLFWLTWLMKEAQCSNVIEGTVTTFVEIAGENAGVAAPIDRRDDIAEVMNYRAAMLEGMTQISEGRSLSLSLVKYLHSALLTGTRGRNKTPGEFRKVPVHIGRPGESVENALYIPPEVYRLVDLLENWERFIKRDDLNPIVQIAVAHAQFELIHPFLDGNGRMGRLIITLFLASKKLIHKPCLYMSSYLQSHRRDYYDALGDISKRGDWTKWLLFFLEGVETHCGSNIELLDEMANLYEISKRRFSEATNSSIVIDILDYVFANPVFTVPGLMKQINPRLTHQGVVSVIKKLEKAGLVEELQKGRGKRPNTYQFFPLIRLLL